MSAQPKSSSGRQLGLGLIGCGGFGEFCMGIYSELDGLKGVAVADSVAAAADRVGRRFAVPAHYDPAELIRRDDVDIVHLATPPSSHHELALAAARAGKHVLCEKPLAVQLDHADELLAAAAKSGVIMPVNFVLRYNPVTDAVKAIIDSGVLGRPIHASLENFAGDEQLSPKHWFWDKAVSGGIFIEHVVHFFDLYNHWFGPGEMISAHVEVREGSSAEDRVMCLTRHDGGVTVNHYHGFDQPGKLDRQNHHLLFETGDMYVYGWIPESLAITAIVTDEQQSRLEQICSGARIDVLARYDTPQAAQCSGRWQQYAPARKISIEWDPGVDKDTLYRSGVRDLMADQLAYIAEPAHRRRVTEQNGRDALALAVAAAQIAQQHGS